MEGGSSVSRNMTSAAVGGTFAFWKTAKVEKREIFLHCGCRTEENNLLIFVVQRNKASARYKRRQEASPNMRIFTLDGNRKGAEWINFRLFQFSSLHIGSNENIPVFFHNTSIAFSHPSISIPLAFNWIGRRWSLVCDWEVIELISLVWES